MTTVQIGPRAVGPGAPTLVIAEVGVNHDGSVARALELVHIASRCGADAVKLQLFHAETLMNAASAFADYQRDRVDAANPIEMLKRFELSPADVGRIVALIRELKMIPLATPFSPQDVLHIERLNLPAVKIASPDLVNRPLLQAVAALGKPVLMSTGAATIDEVDQAVRWARGWNIPACLLHCVSAYPVPDTQAHLAWISEMKSRWAVPVGYSDHTTNDLAGALAVAAGACVVERHLTYNKRAAGPDHAASSDEAEFARYVSLIRSAEALLGDSGKRVLAIEQDIRTVSRQSLALRRAVAAGQALCDEDLIVQRPGTGIPAAEWESVVGRRTGRALPAETLLQSEMLEEIKESVTFDSAA